MGPVEGAAPAGRPAGGRHRASLVPPQFPYRPRLATRWRQTSGDGHGYPALRRTGPRVPQRGRGTSACPQSRTAAVTSRLQGRAHAGEAEGPRRQRKTTAQVGGGVPSGDPQGGARRGSEVKIQEAAHGGDAWGISLRRDPFPGKRMRTAFLRVDYEGGRWVGAPRRMSSRTGRRRGCRGRRKTRGFQTGAGSRARVGRGVQDGQRGGHGGPGPACQVLPRLRGFCSSSRRGVPPRPLPLPPVRTLAAPSFSSPFRQN